MNKGQAGAKRGLSAISDLPASLDAQSPSKAQRLSTKVSTKPSLSKKDTQVLPATSTSTSTKKTKGRKSTSSILEECCICLEGMEFPITLPCNHKFCFLCLKDVRKEQGTLLPNSNPFPHNPPAANTTWNWGAPFNWGQPNSNDEERVALKTTYLFFHPLCFYRYFPFLLPKGRR